MTVQVIHKNSSVQNRPILETQLANGELGINYHESGPFVQLKDTDGEVIRVGGVVQQETQPGLGQKGAWWFKPSTKILYLHNGTTWVAIGGAGGGGGGGDVTNTSQLINDGQNGVDPYITAQDLTPPGDGELTIRQGGVSKGIFKANQSGDAIIDLDGGGVTKLVAGTNVTLDPASGVGDVTINASGGSGSVDLDYTPASNKGTITNTSGTDAEIPIVDASNAGLMTPSQKTKLDDAAETGDIGNATLTVTQGGVSKGTFTANATGDVTIALDAGGGTPPGDGTISIETAEGVPVGSFSVNQSDDETIVLPPGGGEGIQIGDPVSLLTNDADYVTDTDVGKGQISIFTTDGPVASFNVNQSADQDITIPTGGGTPQVQSDYTQADTAAVDYIKNKPDLTALATALQPGDNVSELINNANYITSADIPAQVQSDYTQADAAAVDFIKNKPDLSALPTALQPGDDISELTNNANYITSADIPAQVQSDYTQADTAAVDYIKNKPDLSLKADLVGGVIPTSQLPAIAISQFLGTVDSEAAMLALTGQTGDYCIRTDLSTTWIISGPDGSSIDYWTEIVTPTSPVESVNGQTGVVVLSPADIGAATAAEGALAVTALQPSDNISELTNDSDYLVKGSINPVLYATFADLPAAADNHGGVAHVHETGLEYYAHAGNWIALAKASDVPAAQVQSNWAEADSALVSFIQNKPSIPIVYWQQAAGVLSPLNAGDVIEAAGYRIDQLTTLP